jgi:hypothetical protein
VPNVGTFASIDVKVISRLVVQAKILAGRCAAARDQWVAQALKAKAAA